MGLDTSWSSTQERGLMTSLISKSSNVCRVFFLVLGQAQQRHGAGFYLPHSLLTFLFFAGNQKLPSNFQIYWICPSGLRFWQFALCFALWSFPEAMNVEYPIGQNRGRQEIGRMAGGSLVSASQYHWLLINGCGRLLICASFHAITQINLTSVVCRTNVH